LKWAEEAANVKEKATIDEYEVHVPFRSVVFIGILGKAHCYNLGVHSD
jgi:hypothetical protein